MQSILTNQSKEPEEDVLNSYQDGKFYKDVFKHEEGDELLIPLLLYSDDLEPANPLGGNRGAHKVCAFYVSVLSIPKRNQGNLSNILLVALAKSKLVAEYGMNSVLKVIVDDLEKLYNEGLYIDVPAVYQGYVKPKLFQVIGDNLAVHSMLGFTCCFTANYPCRTCKSHKTECKNQVEEDQGMLRTEESYTQDVATNDLSSTGVSSYSYFSDLSYFSVVDNYARDTMHDMLEGVIPMEVKLVLQDFIDEDYISLEEVNCRISSFSYGFPDTQNRPNIIKASALANPKGASGQKAAQMQCLFKFLPLMIGDKIPEDSEPYELLLCLLEIYKLVIAPSISTAATYALKRLIEDHHRLFLDLYPDVGLTPKAHHLVHYPTAIRQLGPLSPFSCIRYEGKHKPLKHFGKISNNFINIEKTIATKHQVAQAHGFILNEDVEFRGVEIHGQDVMNAIEMTDAEREVAGYVVNDAVVVVKSAVVNGYEYRPNSLVIVAWGSDYPEFGEVQRIIQANSQISLIIQPWTTKYFDRHYHAYAVDKNSNEGLIVKTPTELGDYKPVHAVNSQDERDKNLYVAVRFTLA